MSDKKPKKSSSNKVIRYFTVEIADISTAPEVFANPTNPYAGMSDDARIRDFDSIFGLLLAESYRQDDPRKDG